MSESELFATATRLLDKAADRSRRSNVAYSLSFARALNPPTDGPVPPPPLARLIQGGRGGEARLKLYLLLTMMATGAPYDIRNPPTPLTLARTIGLSPKTGPRRINNGMKWLSDNRFISLTKRPGMTSSIQLLDLQDTDRSTARNPRDDTRYITIPITFWSQGWLVYLSPTGIAVLFALRE